MARPTYSGLDVTEAGAVPARVRSTVGCVFKSLRPEQWTKNLFVLAALPFGLKLFDPASVALALAAFVVFCALSGVVYLINDLTDRDADRLHPIKRLRPIASGELDPRTASVAAVAIGGAALAGALAIGPSFVAITVGYVALFALYSLWLKHAVIVDVLVIALGFALRTYAGAVAIGVPVSDWILICTTLLALFLGLAKRRHELTLLADDAAGHRRNLDEYTTYLLDQMIGVVTASTLMAYIIYCTSADTVERFGTHLLVLTIPFPIYGILRYLYLVHRRDGGGNPSELLITDRPLLICVGLWGLMTTLVIYRPFGL